MYRKKTSHGVPIRSTLGMRAQHSGRHWILVADRHRVALFRLHQEPGESRLSLQAERFNAPESFSDRPGRTFDSHDMSHHGQTGGPRHGYGRGDEPERHMMDRLIHEATDLISREEMSSSDRLTVLAEPRLMGRLRPALLAAVPRAQADFEEKDYAWLADTRLEDRLAPLISPKSMRRA